MRVPLTARNTSLSMLAMLAISLSAMPADAQSSSDGPSPAREDESPGPDIVVTGSNIRSENKTLLTDRYSRDQIERSGAGTVEQFIQQIPQNSGAGITENFASGLSGSGGSFTQGTAINLRGLGANSTLILLNGRRLAPSGFGDFVDVSIVPVSALQRIDILRDGASSIYGADAVGGVVNFITRRDFSGFELSARTGFTPEGGGESVRLSPAAGQVWNGGNGFVVYEYYRRKPLTTEQRSFSRGAGDPSNLLGSQERHSVVAHAEQELGSGLSLILDGIWSTRDFLTFTSDRRNPQGSRQIGTNDQWGGTAALISELGSGWTGEVSATRMSSTSFNENTFAATGVVFGRATIRSDVLSFDGKLEGPLFRLPGGPVRLAVGGQYRDEDYKSRNLVRARQDARQVKAGFAELLVPLFGSQNAKPALASLDLSASYRYEDYTRFGDAGDPRLALAWSPVRNITLQGSWGTSRRVPTHENLSELGGAYLIFPVPDPLTGGTTPSLLLTGGNASLKPERATTWTLGGSVEEADFRLSGNWFRIDYRDRIGNAGNDLLGFLSFLDQLAPYAFRNPSPALVQSYASQPQFGNPFNLPLSSVGAFYDVRLQNVGTLEVEGFDGGAEVSLPLAGGTVSLLANGTVLTRYRQRTTPNSPQFERLDTIGNPLSVRIRAGAAFSSGGFAGSLFADHRNAYSDNRVTPARPIDSWTTFDLSLLQTIRQAGRGRFDIGLAVQNIFDTDPPYVVDTINSVFFDGVNATALGRHVTITARASW